ncbi:hypothetical protein PFISCL1PPCAC_14891 [Pristionchus fissidentatus]|uniref:Prefoldin subunit n=1 Tax=Pristionchus fissidentatus TaxID=1538716 RepID=A0AAV5VYZ2_9BILA|nr:hypothetical protein PFISCL1PPCAC_14891 [Pristionchus fissidentatus]
MEKYESYVRERLLPDKLTAQKSADELASEVREYQSLLVTLDTIVDNELKEMETRVNMGNNMFMHANVEDTSQVIVKLMDGVFASLPMDRARNFIPKRIDILQSRITILEKKMCDIQATIDTMLASINHFQSIQQ